MSISQPASMSAAPLCIIAYINWLTFCSIEVDLHEEPLILEQALLMHMQYREHATPK